MATPKKTKSKGGRPPSFKSPEELENKIQKYLKECEEKEKPVLVVGFAVFCNVHKDTIYEYAKKPEYSDSLKRLTQAAEHSLVSGGLVGKYNSSFAIFLAKNNHKYKDKVEQEVQVKKVKSFDDFYN